MPFFESQQILFVVITKRIEIKFVQINQFSDKVFWQFFEEIRSPTRGVSDFDSQADVVFHDAVESLTGEVDLVEGEQFVLGVLQLADEVVSGSTGVAKVPVRSDVEVEVTGNVLKISKHFLNAAIKNWFVFSESHILQGFILLKECLCCELVKMCNY